jgi:hypothetical protein
MKLSTFAIIITILAAGFGLAFLFIPVKLMAVYGINLDSSGVIVARYFGSANLFVAMIFWSYSGVSPAAKSWPKLLLYSLIYNILQLIVTFIPILSGEANSMAWTTVALFMLLSIGSVYFIIQCNKAKV